MSPFGYRNSPDTVEHRRRISAVTKMLRERGTLSTEEIAAALGISSELARRSLLRMAARGAINAYGAGRARRYSLADETADS